MSTTTWLLLGSTPHDVLGVGSTSAIRWSKAGVDGGKGGRAVLHDLGDTARGADRFCCRSVCDGDDEPTGLVVVDAAGAVFAQLGGQRLHRGRLGERGRGSEHGLRHRQRAGERRGGAQREDGASRGRYWH